MKKNLPKKYLVYLYLLLGALAAFPPLVTDMYLPALPVMTAEFQTTASAVQMSLATCTRGKFTINVQKMMKHIDGPVGVIGSGELTNYINVYRIKTGIVHGCSGNS